MKMVYVSRSAEGRIDGNTAPFTLSCFSSYDSFCSATKQTHNFVYVDDVMVDNNFAYIYICTRRKVLKIFGYFFINFVDKDKF